MARGRISIVSEVWAFMRSKRRLWLGPVLVAILLLAGLLVVAQSSAVGPFVYTLF